MSISPASDVTDGGARAGIAGMVLAAGSGTRFGEEKQLATLSGRPLLEHAVQAMRDANVGPVVVVLGAGSDRILKKVELSGTEVVICRDWQVGLSASLAAGLEAVDEASAVLITLGDQPLITPAAIRRLVAHRGDSLAVRATYHGRAGHPVLIERPLFALLCSARGDHGARDVLAGADVRLVPCEDVADDVDVDRREDLTALEHRTA